MSSSGIKIYLDILEAFYSNILDRRFWLRNNPMYQQYDLLKIEGIDLGFWLVKGPVYEFKAIWIICASSTI